MLIDSSSKLVLQVNMAQNSFKILVVDDDPDLRDIYDETFTEAGYQVDLACDGQEGLDKIFKGGYDLILLDIMMPKIDGLTVLKKIKTSGITLPPHTIVMLSQLNEENIIKQALDLGAKEYLVKSDYTPDQVLKKIKDLLSKQV